jgi:protein-S-isoprenylcysteine O-methyltransferase Ste14
MSLSDRPFSVDTATKAEWAGRLLVTLQFSLLAIMGWRAWALPSSSGVLAGTLLSGSALLALWALAANRPGNFNIRPTPRQGGTLVTSGPYRWVRHPMYTSVLMVAAAAAVESEQIADAGLWLALLAVLWVKSGIEERALMIRFPDYQAYKARTNKFLPGPVWPYARSSSR